MSRLFRIDSIQSKIIIWTGLAMLVLLIIIVMLSVNSLTGISVRAAQHEAATHAQYYATRVKAQIDEPFAISRSLADALAATQVGGKDMALSRDQVNTMLLKILNQNPSYLGIWTGWEPDAFDGQDASYKNSESSDSTGRFIPYWVRGVGGKIHLEPLRDYETLAYYQCPKTTGKECIIDPYIYAVEGKDKLLASVAVPIIIDGKVAGVIGIDMELSDFQVWADGFNEFNNMATLRLIGNNGLFAAVKGQTSIVNQSVTTAKVSDDVAPILAKIQKGEEFNHDTADQLSYYTPVSFGKTTTPWSINIIIPQQMIHQEANALIVRQTITGIVLALIGILVIWLLSLQIARPVRQITAVAQAVTAGRFDVQASSTANDETGILARAFNEMIDRVRQMLDNERQQREHLEQSVQEYVQFLNAVARGNLAQRLTIGHNGETADDPLVKLGQNLNYMTEQLQRMIIEVRRASEALNQTTAEILASTTQQASSASEQSAAIAQTTTTVDEVRAIANQASQQADQVSESAQQTVKVSRSGQKAVVETIESMGQIKHQVEGIAENILALSEQTQQIGEIISTVNSIAAQSNMLALNASIEAARAGENGKGFAVVATEVRTLAEQSHQATVQVKQILSEIQKATNGTVMATEEGAKRVESGVQLALESQKSIEQLAEVIMASSQAAMQVAAGSRQQTTGVDQIATAMQNIHQATIQSLASTRQAEQAARNLNELAQRLVKTVDQYQV